METEFYDIELDNLESKTDSLKGFIDTINLVREYLNSDLNKEEVLKKYSSKLPPYVIRELNEEYFQKISEFDKSKMSEPQKERLEKIVTGILKY